MASLTMTVTMERLFVVKLEDGSVYEVSTERVQFVDVNEEGGDIVD